MYQNNYNRYRGIKSKRWYFNLLQGTLINPDKYERVAHSKSASRYKLETFTIYLGKHNVMPEVDIKKDRINVFSNNQKKSVRVSGVIMRKARAFRNPKIRTLDFQYYKGVQIAKTSRVIFAIDSSSNQIAYTESDFLLDWKKRLHHTIKLETKFVTKYGHFFHGFFDGKELCCHPIKSSGKDYHKEVLRRIRQLKISSHLAKSQKYKDYKTNSTK